MLLAALLPFLATNCQMILLHLSISNRAHCERQQQVLIGADATVRVLCAPASRSTALPVLICSVNVDVASAQPAACDWLRLSLPRSRRFAASFLCVCVCARVCSWLWLLLCVCVCACLVLNFFFCCCCSRQLHYEAKESILVGSRVFRVRRSTSSHVFGSLGSQHTQNPNRQNPHPHSHPTPIRTDLGNGLRIQFCDSESAFEFRALRLQLIACCLSLSLACHSVCVRVCIYLFISVLAN